MTPKTQPVAKRCAVCAEFALHRYDVAMPPIGPLEIGVILLVILLIVGPKKLPGLGRSLGTGMREFKDSVTGRGGSDQDEPAKIDPAPAAEPAATEQSAVPEEQPRQPRGDA